MYAGSLECTKLLVQQGINIWKKNQQQQVALTSAAESEQWDIFDFLLGEYANQRPERDFLLEKDEHGWIPLHYLCWCSNDDIIRKLLQSGDGEAMCLATDDEKDTPFHGAASKGNIVMVKILLDYNPPLDVPGLNVSHGATPIDQAFHYWQRAIDETEKYEEVVELLASRVEVPNRMHKFQCAIEKGSTRLCKLFLDLKNAKDDYGWTPVRLAIQCQNPETLSLLSIDDASLQHGTPSPDRHRPSRWSMTDKSEGLNVSEDGMEAYISGRGESTQCHFTTAFEANRLYVVGRHCCVLRQ